ncbi:MAG: glycosyltransferase family 2 protein [Prevotella sp.]|jgi:glycosyltransferase involved in cell wall biosynthesis
MLSIIIPVYKTEATLERCISSVLRQQVDLEVILVDDGSPDNCPRLCDEWDRRDPRVRTFHQPNQGLSAARNTGIEQARGEYLTFVDSDDYLSSGTYGPLMDKLSNHPEYDILEYGVVKFENTSERQDIILADRVYHDRLEYWLRARAYDHAYAWNKIYRRWIFDHVRFPVGRVFEDVQILPHLVTQAQCVATVSTGCYHYTLNEKGITRQAGANEVAQLLEAHLPLLKDILKGNTHALDADDDLSRYYLMVLNIQITYMLLSGKKAEIPHYPFRIPFDLPMRTRLKDYCIRIFGLAFYVRLLRLLPMLQSRLS